MFSPEATDYEVTVGFLVASVNIIASVRSALANVTEITVNGDPISGTTVDLDPGVNTIVQITVTAGDGSTKIYTIDIFRELAAADASVENIWLSGGVEWDTAQGR